jgi:hypothetical protein
MKPLPKRKAQARKAIKKLRGHLEYLRAKKDLLQYPEGFE